MQYHEIFQNDLAQLINENSILPNIISLIAEINLPHQAISWNPANEKFQVLVYSMARSKIATASFKAIGEFGEAERDASIEVNMTHSVFKMRQRRFPSYPGGYEAFVKSIGGEVTALRIKGLRITYFAQDLSQRKYIDY